MEDNSTLLHASFTASTSNSNSVKGLQNGTTDLNVIDIKFSWASDYDWPKTRSDSYSIIVLDVTIGVRFSEETNKQEYENSDGLKTLLTEVQTKALLVPGVKWTGRVILVLPTRTGYFLRTSCFLERFIGCEDFGILIDQSVVGKRTGAVKSRRIQDILDNSALMLVRSNKEPQLSSEAEVVEEIQARINFSWLLDEEPKKTTLALVDGHLNLESYLGLWKSAIALGVKIVLLDRPDHWITDPSYRHLYDDYISIDMTPDDGFPLRIAEAVRAYGPVDGICATATYCLPPVAKAASLLGLPTEPPEAIACANDKYETRLVEAENIQRIQVADVQDLMKQLAQGEFVPEYPLIVKPSFGTGSAYVYKVDNENELIEGARRISKEIKRKILIETYVDGPELDINFVLLDGELLFFEMNDDFPSPGDDSPLEGHFWETINVFPTILPPDEFALLRDNLHQLLLKMGLKTGVFHLEARVQNSTMDYNCINGIYDLRSKSNTAANKLPRCFLIEVNPRPPGMACCYATGATYGVNLYDLHVLRMLGDFERFRALAKSFDSHPSIPYEARIWSELFWLKADKGGICATDERNSERISQMLPEHQSMINRSVCFFSRGQRIPEPAPGVVRLGGFLFLTSRKSREDILRLSHILEQDLSIPVSTV